MVKNWRFTRTEGARRHLCPLGDRPRLRPMSGAWTMKPYRPPYRVIPKERSRHHTIFATIALDRLVPPPGSRDKTTGNRVLTRMPTSSKGPDSKSAVTTASVATTSSAKFSSLGTWICDACTFENLRNITRNSRCEMCDSVRPKEPVPNSRKLKDVEVVNIDC